MGFRVRLVLSMDEELPWEKWKRKFAKLYSNAKLCGRVGGDYSNSQATAIVPSRMLFGSWVGTPVYSILHPQAAAANIAKTISCCPQLRNSGRTLKWLKVESWKWNIANSLEVHVNTASHYIQGLNFGWVSEHDLNASEVSVHLKTDPRQASPYLLGERDVGCPVSQNCDDVFFYATERR